MKGNTYTKRGATFIVVERDGLFSLQRIVRPNPEIKVFDESGILNFVKEYGFKLLNYGNPSCRKG